MELKTCRRCQLSKPVTEFNRKQASPDGYETRCRSCVSEVRSERYHANPELHRERNRAYRNADPERRRRATKRTAQWRADNPGRRVDLTRDALDWYVYHLTPEESEALGRVCRLCGSTDRLVIDHDHACCSGRRSCGKCVRGRLCHSCNQGLGMFRDDPELLVAAALYLEEWRVRCGS